MTQSANGSKRKLIVVSLTLIILFAFTMSGMINKSTNSFYEYYNTVPLASSSSGENQLQGDLTTETPDDDDRIPEFELHKRKVQQKTQPKPTKDGKPLGMPMQLQTVPPVKQIDNDIYVPILAHPFDQILLTENFEAIDRDSENKNSKDGEKATKQHPDDLFGLLSWIEGLETGITPYNALIGTLEEPLAVNGDIFGNIVTSLHNPLRIRNSASDSLFMMRKGKAVQKNVAEPPSVGKSNLKPQPFKASAGVRNPFGKLIDEQDLILNDIYQKALFEPFQIGLVKYNVNLQKFIDSKGADKATAEDKIAEFELKNANVTVLEQYKKPEMRRGADNATLRPSREELIKDFDNLAANFARVMSSIDVVSGPTALNRSARNSEWREFWEGKRTARQKADSGELRVPQLWQVLNPQTVAREISNGIINKLIPIFNDECNNVLSAYYCSLCMIREFAADPLNEVLLHERESYSLSICFSTCRCVQWQRGMWGGNSGIRQARLSNNRSLPNAPSNKNVDDGEFGLSKLIQSLTLPREIAGGGGFSTQSNFRLSHELLEAVYEHSISGSVEINGQRRDSSTPRSGSAAATTDPFFVRTRPPTPMFPDRVASSRKKFLAREANKQMKHQHPAHRHKSAHPGTTALMRDYIGKDLTDPMYREVYDANKHYFYGNDETNPPSQRNVNGSSVADLNSEGAIHRTHYQTIFDRNLEVFLMLHNYPKAKETTSSGGFPVALSLDVAKQQPKSTGGNKIAEEIITNQSKLGLADSDIGQDGGNNDKEDAMKDSGGEAAADADQSSEEGQGSSTNRKLLAKKPVANFTAEELAISARHYFASKLESEAERQASRLILLNETHQLRGVRDLTPLDRQSVAVERFKATSLLSIPSGLNVVEGHESAAESYPILASQKSPHLTSNANWLHFTASKFVTVGSATKHNEADVEKKTTKATAESQQFQLPFLSQLPTLTSLEILAILHRLSDRGNKLILFAGDSMLREMFLHLLHRIRYSDRNHAAHYWRNKCGRKSRNMMKEDGDKTSPHVDDHSKFTSDYCGEAEESGTKGSAGTEFYDDQPPFFDMYHHNDMIYSVYPDGDMIHQYTQAMGRSRKRGQDFLFRRRLQHIRDSPRQQSITLVPKEDYDFIMSEEKEESVKSSADSNQYNDCPPRTPLSYCNHPDRHLRPLFQVLFLWDPMIGSRIETWLESPNFKYHLSLRGFGFDIAAQINAKPYWEIEMRRPRKVFSYLYDHAVRFEHSPYPNQTHQLFLNSPIPKRQLKPEENYKNYLYTRKNAALWYITKEIHQLRESFHNSNGGPDVRQVFNWSQMVENYDLWKQTVGATIPTFTTSQPPPNERGTDRKLPFWPSMPSTSKSLAVMEWDKLQQLHQFSTSDLKHFACSLSPAAASHDKHPKFISKSLSYFTKVTGAWSGERHYRDTAMMEAVTDQSDTTLKPSSPKRSYGHVVTRKHLIENFLSHERTDIIYHENNEWALNTTKAIATLASEDESKWHRSCINAMCPKTERNKMLGEQQLFRDFMAARAISQPGVQSTLIRSEDEPSFAYWMKYNVKRQKGAVTVRRIDDELQCRNVADWASLQTILYYLSGLETTY